MSDTYEEKGKKEIWIRQNQAGLDKRFCTLELCFRPGPDQPKPGAVFRGKGTRISAVEKAAWDERVHVMFQEKAWVDRKTNDKYCTEILCPYMAEKHPPEEDKLLFCDNLDAQKTQTFLDLLHNVGCSRFLTPPETTDLTQPVDGGLGRLEKFLIGKECEEWLEEGENLEQWENGTITASQKRILITKWVGNAWDITFKSGKYEPDKFFEHTGCLLTLDGSEDDKVKIQGLPNYRPLAPHLPHTDVECLELEPDLQPDMPEPEVPTNITCIDRTEHDEETYLVDEAENSLEDQQQIQFGEEEYALLVM